MQHQSDVAFAMFQFPDRARVPPSLLLSLSCPMQGAVGSTRLLRLVLFRLLFFILSLASMTERDRDASSSQPRAQPRTVFAFVHSDPRNARPAAAVGSARAAPTVSQVNKQSPSLQTFFSPFICVSLSLCTHLSPCECECVCERVRRGREAGEEAIEGRSGGVYKRGRW